jgi:lactoylglutathione lyase
MLRVGNLSKRADFYTRLLGMKVLRISPTAFGHLAFAMDDVAATCQALEEAGYVVARKAGPVLGGSTVIAFIVDPDGYKIELIEGRNKK